MLLGVRLATLVVAIAAAAGAQVSDASEQTRAPVDQPSAILVSRQLAATAHLSVGDVVTLGVDAEGTRGRQFRVAGVYEPTPDPMRFTAERLEARLHLPDLVDIVADPREPG